MKALGFALVALLAVGACGDNSGPGNGTDGGSNTHSDGGTTNDGGNVTTNFTAFVIDLVQNHTNSTTAPVPYATFATLADPDTNNGSAYSSLF